MEPNVVEENKQLRKRVAELESQVASLQETLDKYKESCRFQVWIDLHHIMVASTIERVQRFAKGTTPRCPRWVYDWTRWTKRNHYRRSRDFQELGVFSWSGEKTIFLYACRFHCAFWKYSVCDSMGTKLKLHIFDRCDQATCLYLSRWQFHRFRGTHIGSLLFSRPGPWFPVFACWLHGRNGSHFPNRIWELHHQKAHSRRFGIDRL